MVLLEYHPDQGYHHNTVIPCEHRFSSELFSYGWKPVCIIPDDLWHDPEYQALTDRLEEEHASYETVVREVILFVMSRYEKMEEEAM
jgi:hypothetical protein